MEEKQKTLKQEAQEYEPPLTLNVADLEIVPIGTVYIKEKESKDKDEKPFSYKFFELAGKEYRVPNSVLEKIQEMLRLRPNMKYIKVTKSGSGLATRYKVDIVNDSSSNKEEEKPVETVKID